MPVYQIDYDLRKQRDYQALYERIKTYSAWCRPLRSTWVIQTSDSATQVHNFLAGTVDAADSLLITRLQGEAAWLNLSPGVEVELKHMLQTRAA